VDAERDALAAAAEAAGWTCSSSTATSRRSSAPPPRGGVHRLEGVRPRTADEFAAAARRYAGAVDALLVDGWSPVDHGGTGTRFPWAEVAAHRGALPPGTRLVAAGGLTPANVGEAVRVPPPYAVDVSSGVEDSPGASRTRARGRVRRRRPRAAADLRLPPPNPRA
jgi:hypothetical protein